MKYILAIDQGTTGSRAIVYDKSGHKIASAYEEFTQFFPKPGWVEHNPEEIWKSVNNSIQKVLKKVSPRSIIAIGITNQRETTVIWDRKTGKPIHNAIVWQCRRTADRCSQIRKHKNIVKYIRSETGLTVDPYFSATKLEWLLKKVPGAMIQALKGNLCFGTTDSWILWKLTGAKSHATDYTNASRTMLYNIRKLEWDKKLLKLFSIPASILPEVRSSSGKFGDTIKIGLLPSGIPITGIAGDQQAALFGQNCFEPGTVKNTYGTGCFMLMNTGHKKISSNNGLITTLACSAHGKPIYALEGSVFIAGAAIQWLRDQVELIETAKESEKLASSVEDNGGVFLVPAFVGLGAPYWSSETRGLVTGLTRGTTKAHLVRAALESMCYQTKDILDAMEKDSGLKIKELRVDGGAVANNFICQFQADILGTTTIRPIVIETTSLGAAFLAGLSIGYWTSTNDIQQCWKADKIFKPEMLKTQAELNYKGWQRAVRQALTT